MAKNSFDIDIEWLDNGTNGTLDKPFLEEEQVKLLVDGLTQESLKIALAILDRAQTKVPVDTGFLKSTGQIIERENGFEVAYTADYAYYVHENDYAKHKVGQAKYLEEAYNEIMQELMRDNGGD